jgi:hypothetical protein
MGLFRPARTVNGPSGRWELYVSKTALPAWKEGKPTAGEDFGGSFSGEGMVVEAAIGIVSFLWASILLPLVRFLVVLPVAFVRGRRSWAIRIEAVNPFPQREVLLWTTTDDAKDRVLDEIAAGLAEGKVVRPVGAVYSGREAG